MALFNFELLPVERIQPWGTEGNESLSWFALTDGRFNMVVGESTLFRYSDDALAQWGVVGRDAEYQIAAFARDILGAYAAALAPLPGAIQELVRDWRRLERLRTSCTDDDSDECMTAWRWLGERSPWMSYLTACPQFAFVRLGDEVWIHWDNRACEVDGVLVWTATAGEWVVPIEKFAFECRDFADRILQLMAERIDAIEDGTARPRAQVDVASLREQHERWRVEFASYFGAYEPEVPWPDAEAALRAVARRAELRPTP